MAKVQVLALALEGEGRDLSYWGLCGFDFAAALRKKHKMRAVLFTKGVAGRRK
jgi:hypothetical protein